MAKHRSTIFVVVRVHGNQETPTDSYASLERAGEVADIHTKEWHEKGFVEFSFIVKPMTFYDE